MKGFGGAGTFMEMEFPEFGGDPVTAVSGPLRTALGLHRQG